MHHPTQDNTYRGLCYTSRGALAGTRNSSMGSIINVKYLWYLINCLNVELMFCVCVCWCYLLWYGWVVQQCIPAFLDFLERESTRELYTEMDTCHTCVCVLMLLYFDMVGSYSSAYQRSWISLRENRLENFTPRWTPVKSFVWNTNTNLHLILDIK